MTLVEQFLGPLSATTHVPLISPLGIDDLLPVPVTQVLRCRKIRVTVMGDVALGRLSHCDDSNNEQQTDNKDHEEFGFERGWEEFSLGKAGAARTDATRVGAFGCGVGCVAREVYRKRRSFGARF